MGESKRTCSACGNPKVVPTEIRPKGKSCFDCQLKRKRAQEKYVYQNDPEVRAKRRKYYRDRYAEKKDEIYAKRRAKLMSDRTLQDKQREYEKAWRDRLIADPEKHAAHLKKMRERNAKRMKNPEIRQRANENRRISRRKKWEEQGRTLKPVSMELYRKYNKVSRDLFPLAPLMPVMEHWLLEHTQDELADLSGVAGRRIYSFRHGQETGQRDSIERLCLAMGTTFELVYGEAAADENRPLTEISA